MPADYRYDVFFSYKRHSLTLEWTTWVHSQLQYWLTLELAGREANVFIDDVSIEAGERWAERLKEALRSSRCMVCVWSPAYFQSDWCHSEWRSFREREERLKIGSHGLIVPLRYHDGEHFPEEAKSVQWIDVEPYTSTLPAFWKTSRAMKLEDKVKELAGRVATIVRTSPPFQDNWPVVEAKGTKVPRIGLAQL